MLLCLRCTISRRSYHFSTYRSCFVGSEAVDYLVREQLADTRKAAVALGERMAQAGFFHHVVDDHGFEDRYLFYRFFVDETVRERQRMYERRR